MSKYTRIKTKRETIMTNEEITQTIRQAQLPLLEKIAEQQREIDLLYEDTNVMKLIQSQLLTLVPVVTMKMFSSTLRKQIQNLPDQQSQGEMAQIALKSCDEFDAMFGQCSKEE